MSSQTHELLETTWSAVQASVSVILILFYGYLARKHELLSQEGENNISKLCVQLFLPFLLFSEIGPLASWSNIKEYWVIVAYSVLFQVVSWGFGEFGVRVFKMPQWIVPCMVFYNATSLPLLMFTTLADSGVLDPLLGNGESTSDLLSRGKVYVLINALVCNLSRFTLGPYMMQPHHSDLTIDLAKLRKLTRTYWTHESPHAPINWTTQTQKLISHADVLINPAQPLPQTYPHVEPYPEESETSPLLYRAKVEGRRSWRILNQIGLTLGEWLNPPMMGGLAAVIVGVIPPLHNITFGDGVPLSPITKSISNLGDLYASLQAFVLGAHLKSKKGSRPPMMPLIYVLVFRFILMPAISLSTVYGIRKGLETRFCMTRFWYDLLMMILAVGPPALTLAAIVEMSHSGEDTTAVVAKVIIISYIATPLLSLSVTAALAVVKNLYGLHG